jgi:HD-GYP domain-containing protein (c-di-GMP phosphodiesterase class II)
MKISFFGIKEDYMSSMYDNTELNYFITRFNATVINMHLYAPDHPQAERYLLSTFNTLKGLLRIMPEVTLMLVGHDMVVNNNPVPVERLDLVNFCHLLRDSGIERLTFSHGLKAGDFQQFVRELSGNNGNPIRRRPGIKIGKVDLRVKSEAVSGSGMVTADKNEKIQPIRDIRYEKLDEIKELYHTARRYKRIDIRGVDDIIKAFVQGFIYGINPLGLMASLKSSDEYTFTHVVNVCILTMAQAEALGFEGNYLYQIGVASMLHDVGKLFIPEEIINKPGKLTDEERLVIETHTTKGARYLLRIENIPKLAVLGAIEHHIRFDGTGYPSLGSGWKTNIVSQMIAISDVFDALRSRRVYSEPKPQDLINKILKEEKGTTFNPFLVNNFFKIIGEKKNDGSEG